MTVYRRIVDIHKVIIGNIRNINRVNIIPLLVYLFFNVNSFFCVHLDGGFIAVFNKNLFLNDLTVGHNTLTGNSSAVCKNIRISVAVVIYLYINTEISTSYSHYRIGSVYHISLILAQRLCKLICDRSFIQTNNCAGILTSPKLHKLCLTELLQLNVFVRIKNHSGVAVGFCPEGNSVLKIHIFIGSKFTVSALHLNCSEKLGNSYRTVTLLAASQKNDNSRNSSNHCYDNSNYYTPFF